jgi:hypothetical protein
MHPTARGSTATNHRSSMASDSAPASHIFTSVTVTVRSEDGQNGTRRSWKLEQTRAHGRVVVVVTNGDTRAQPLV